MKCHGTLVANWNLANSYGGVDKGRYNPINMKQSTQSIGQIPHHFPRGLYHLQVHISYLLLSVTRYGTRQYGNVARDTLMTLY